MKRWIAKTNGKNRIYALYPSVRQAGFDNWLNDAFLRKCIRNKEPDYDGYYYQYCSDVTVILNKGE